MIIHRLYFRPFWGSQSSDSFGHAQLAGVCDDMQYGGHDVFITGVVIEDRLKRMRRESWNSENGEEILMKVTALTENRSSGDLCGASIID